SAAARHTTMRIASVQLDSKHANVETNIATVKRLLASLMSQASNTQQRDGRRHSDAHAHTPPNERRTERPVDLLVLPELALTGYVFRDHADIEPLLEVPGPVTTLHHQMPQGRSSLEFAADLARTLHCYVVVGFPERVNADEAATRPYDARPTNVRDEGPPPRSFHAYNSAALFDATGKLLHVFRKHFLYEDDKRWASQGPGFETIQLPGLGTVCVAICMDLNPFEFETSFEACELASFCVEQDVDLLIVPMAWLLPSDETSDAASAVSGPAKPSLSTINYWALRCLPFFDPTQSNAKASGQSSDAKPKYLLTANRTGTEGKSTFAGSSCVLQMKPNERPLLLESLGTREEGLLIVDLPIDKT
ncbi:carbon-nitrogen hydrolase, partial [Testicularia cyperi]